MPWITKEGRSVDEAREAAIAASGRSVDDLEIEVVNEGAKGLFGLGGEPAVVRVRPRDEATDYRYAFRSDNPPVATPPRDESDDEGDVEDETPYAATESVASAVEEEDEADAVSDEEAARQREEAAQLGEEIVRGIIERMDLSGEIRTRIDNKTVYIEVSGEEMGILIGRTGTTLEALQELVRAGIQRRLKTRQPVVVDVESYWERRRKPAQSSERRGGEGRGGRGSGGGGSGGGSGSGGGGRSRGRGGRGGRGRGRRGRGGGGRGGDQNRNAPIDGEASATRPVEAGPEVDGNG